MKKLPKEMISIRRTNVIASDEIISYGYVLNEGSKEETYIPAMLQTYYGRIIRPRKSFDIIDDTRDFVNGFKVVQTANKEYAYVREEDNELLPYRYDIATDFNEYGYAMVGKEVKVSWIDRNFRYFDATLETFLDEEKNKSDRFNGFSSISKFSKGEHHLSKLLRKDYDSDSSVIYLGTDGKIKKFYKYDGDVINEQVFKKEFPLDSTTFDDNDYATFYRNNFILLSSGYYLSTMELIRICEEKGFLDTISSTIEKQEQDYTKFLRDIEEKTTTIADDLSKRNNLIAEFGIGSIELKKEKLISSYGKDVYLRALTNNSLVCLIVNEEMPADIVDIESFQSSLAKRGIPSYIDNEENVFHYNTNKHVIVKKR